MRRPAGSASRAAGGGRGSRDRRIYLAAAQFLDLTQSTLKLLILFGSPERPSDEPIDAVVKSAVDVFLAAYGTEKTREE